jgi:hypothetical protein
VLLNPIDMAERLPKYCDNHMDNDQTDRALVTSLHNASAPDIFVAQEANQQISRTVIISRIK